MKRILLALATAVIGLSSIPFAAADDLLTVAIDRARILRIDDIAETVIVGNPAIMDVAVHDSRTLILTGRSYGVTNLVVLDAAGDTILDEEVAVTSHEVASVRVYRQAQRSTYSCTPSCEPTVTIGDTGATFGGAAEQFSLRESLARGGAQ